MNKTKSVERFGKTVDQAIQEGLAALGVSADEALIEVLDEGEAGGLLGFGRRLACVRVSCEFEEEGAEFEAAAAVAEAEAWRAQEYELDSAGTAAEAEDFSAEGSDFLPAEAADNAEQVRKPKRASSESDLTEEAKNQAEDKGVDFVATVLQSLDIHGKISSYYDAENCLHIDVSGQDVGNAIGRRGETLEALQYLTALAVNTGSENYIRLQVDIGHYRERRQRSLRQEAQRCASRVLRSGKRVAMESMSPAERRLIHVVLSGFEGVTTYSEGLEPQRYVVIAPAEEL